MWQVRVYQILARTLAVMLGWVVLMGLPLLIFHGPLQPEDIKRFLGVFYALLLFVLVALARGYGTPSVLLAAFPFLVLFTALGVRPLLDPVLSVRDKLMTLNYFAIYGVVFLGWRLGLRLRPAPPDEGKQM